MTGGCLSLYILKDYRTPCIVCDSLVCETQSQVLINSLVDPMVVCDNCNGDLCFFLLEHTTISKDVIQLICKYAEVLLHDKCGMCRKY